MTDSAGEGGEGGEDEGSSGAAQGEEGAVEVDGRRRRRDRNREAVLESLIDLVEGGELAPTVAQIAARSSVSLRSVFRYFDDRDGLLAQATELAFRRYAPLSAIHNYGRGSFSDRLDAILNQRLTLFPAISPFVRAARVNGRNDPVMLEDLTRFMAPMREQVEVQFTPELQRLGDDREPILISLDLLLSFQTFELLVEIQDRGGEEARRVYEVTIGSLLAPGLT